MGSARPVRPGFSPLDEELGRLPGKLTPRLHETLVRLSVTHPSFAKASAALAWHTGTTVHADTARRQTEAAGAVLVAHETAEAARILQTYPDSPPGPDTLVASVDGAMVPLVGGQWKDVRTLAVGAVQPPRARPAGPIIQTTDLSYFSRLTDSTTFADLALLELHRRGIARAGRVGAVVDGADWCQGFIDYHCPEAVRMLDLPHAAEHRTAIGQTTGPNGPLLTPADQQRLRQALRDAGPDGVLAELRLLVAACPPDAAVHTHLAYLEDRQAQLHYPQFVADGWPIGSGIVESANKLVVEDRRTGAGMHWAAANVNPMRALRNAWCNDRWAEAWAHSEQGLRQQATAQRQARWAARHPVLAPPPPPPPAPEPAPAAPAPPPSPAAPKVKPPHPWRHPWSVRRQRDLVDAA